MLGCVPMQINMKIYVIIMTEQKSFHLNILYDNPSAMIDRCLRLTLKREKDRNGEKSSIYVLK